ncbi:reverse transcriptase domain-containing protein [Tanacetum coccineum]
MKNIFGMLPSEDHYAVIHQGRYGVTGESTHLKTTKNKAQYGPLKANTLDYGSGVAKPKIDNKDQFELKGQFLKELRENTFSGSDNKDANEHIEKVLEIVDLFYVPNIAVDQLMLRVFPISLTGAASRWLRNEPWEDLKTKFLNKYYPPGRTVKKMEEINNFQQEPDETFFQAWERFKKLLMKFLTQRGAVPTMTAADAKKAIQEMTEYSQKWNNGTSRGKSTETSDRLAAIQAQLNNLGREIRKSRQTTVPFPSRLDNHYYEEEEGNYGPKFTEAYGASYINDTIPRKEKDPEMELADKTVKYPKGIAENVLVGIGKFTFPVDFIILDMPEDIKVPLILRRPFLLSENQGDDLMPTIEEGEVIEEFRTRDEDLDTGIDDYPILHDLEDMDAYRDEGMGNIIVGEPFLREVGIKTKRLEGIITLYNGDDEVTYQMVRLHPNPITFEMRRRKNGSHVGTLACMRWSKREAEEKPNLKTSL